MSKGYHYNNQRWDERYRKQRDRNLSKDIQEYLDNWARICDDRIDCLEDAICRATRR